MIGGAVETRPDSAGMAAGHASPVLPAIYVGEVVHLRVRPVRHRIERRVFSALVDVDNLAASTAPPRLFSYNRHNVFSIFDRDHGPGDGTPLGEHTRRTLAGAGLASCATRIMMLAYPRVFGTVFNPLTVYFCHDVTGGLGALIYEVNNTLGERTTYVLAAGAAENGVYVQTCGKQMAVSPFTPMTADYRFHVTRPGRQVTVGVAVIDHGGALLRTHFRGTATPLDDATLGRLLWRYPLQTLAVTAGIHAEAAKLFAKGVPLARRHGPSRSP
jgi:uncharacterized protein